MTRTPGPGNFVLKLKLSEKKSEKMFDSRQSDKIRQKDFKNMVQKIRFDNPKNGTMGLTVLIAPDLT